MSRILPSETVGALPRWGSRLRVAALALVLAVAGCASGRPPAPGDLASVTPATPDPRAADPGEDAKGIAFGSYLAGQFARARGDTGAATTYFLEAIAADPNNVVLQQQGFALAVTDGRYQDARRLATQLVAEDASNSLPQLFLVLGNVKDGKYGAALTSLETLPEMGLNHLIVPLVRAWALVGEKKGDEALAALTSLDDTPVFRPFGLNHRAYILDYLNDPRAVAAYQAAIGGEGQGNLRTILAYAGLLAHQGRMDEAKEVVANAEERFGDTLTHGMAARQLKEGTLGRAMISGPAAGVAEAFYGSATALSQDSANGPAVFYLRLALYLRPGFSEAQFLYARILEFEEQYQAALRAYKAIPDGDPLATEARLRQAWTLQALKRDDEAFALLKQVAAVEPPTAETLSAYADALRQREDYAAAAAEYTRALSLSGADDERQWVLYYARGIAYDLAKNWPLAEADMKKALELRPDQPDVLNYLGYSWIDRGVDFAAAEAMIKRAVEERPNDGYIVDSLGWALFKQKRYGDAVTQLEKAVLLRPEDPTINEHLGDAYWAAGRHTEARFQWSHALTLGVAEDQVAVIKEKLSAGLKLKGPEKGKERTPSPPGIGQGAKRP